MRIAIAQIDPVVGAFEENVKKITDAYSRAVKDGARILLTPELGICGYPPHDLLERPEMLERTERALIELKRVTKQAPTALIVGYPSTNRSGVGRPLFNQVSVLEQGAEVFSQAKTLLPTYDVFDEARYFESASDIKAWTCDGKKIVIGICEDFWAKDQVWESKIYRTDPVDCYAELKPDLLLSISASPYEWGKRERREKLHAAIVKRVGAPLVYVNQVGANDSILFDGGSFATDISGTVASRFPLFDPGYGTVEFPSLKIAGTPGTEVSELEALKRGLIVGIRDYFHRTGFKKAILGLSGGIDSAVVATLAAQAIGPENVSGIAMPSQHSSSHSLADAEELARRLGIHYDVKPIKFLFSTVSRELQCTESLAQENLQARLRGLFLMTLSNQQGSLVLITGNKSELATGYSTLYGDMAGALAPIGDIFKTRVYELARHLNATLGSPIPDSSLTKPPSAELRPGQTDQDTLPPYADLDALLLDYVEKNASISDLVQRYGTRGAPGWIEAVLKRVEANEFKRAQAPIVLKISPKAFGVGRRVPIAKSWSVQSMNT